MIFYVYMTFKQTNYSQRPCYQRQKYTFGTLSAALGLELRRLAGKLLKITIYLIGFGHQHQAVPLGSYTSVPVFAVFKDSLSLVSLSYNVSEWDQM